MSVRRIGILGGTFDPIHAGHLDLGRAAEATLELQWLFVLTANIPPHRPQPSASSWHRFAMTAMAVSGLDGWRASDFELRAGGQSYIASTLKRFHERRYAPCELFFVIGADAFLEIGSWKDYPAILDSAHFAVVSRPGCPVKALPDRLAALAARMIHPPVDRLERLDPLIWLIDAPTADISSTAIRDRCAAGLPIDGLVPPAVRQHIEQHGLYTATVPDRCALDAAPMSAADRLHGQD